jgi:hypothetical protein
VSQQDDDRYAGQYEEDEDGYDYSDDPNVEAIDPPPEPEPVPVATPERRETIIPIGEAVTPETLHGVVAFTRSLNLGTRDNNAHFRCEMPFVVQPQWSPVQCAAAAADAFYQAVAVVLQQAGLPYAIGDEGVIHEVVKEFPGARRVDQPEPRQDEVSDRRERNGSSGARDFPHPADLSRPEHIRADVWRDLCENYDDWYDNRADKASGDAYKSSPDFKRKDDGKGLWMRPFKRDAGGGRGGGRSHARSGGGRQYRDD